MPGAAAAESRRLVGKTHRRGSDASAMWMYKWIAMGCAGFRASACSISASAVTAGGRKLPS